MSRGDTTVPGGASLGGVAIRWGAATDVGRHRPVNQDSLLAERPLWVIADGMGGHAAGEVASQLALLTMRDAARAPAGAVPSTAQVADAIRAANLAVLQRASADPALRGMGTTICGLALTDDGSGPHLTVVNVGDSRGYVFVDGQLSQVTRDHSYVEDLIEAGEITPDEARTHPRRHIVTRALGVEPGVVVDVWERPAMVGERYLLCSDGLTNELEDASIAQVLARDEPPQALAELLVSMANQAGGRDNISVLVVDVVDGTGGGPGPGGDVRVPAAIGGWLVGDVTVRDDTKADTAAPPLDSVADATTDAASGATDATDAGSGATIPPPPPPLPPPAAEATAPTTTGLLGTKPAPSSPRAAAKARRDAGRRAERARKAARDRRADRRWVSPVRNLLTIAALAAIVAIVLGSIQAYGRAGWYVTFRGDAVTLYEGRPDGLLWVKPQAKLTYPATRSQLTPAWQDRVERRIAFTSRAAADRWFTLLSANPDAAPAIAPRATLPTTTTTIAPTTTTTTTVDPTATTPPVTIGPVATAGTLAPEPTTP